MIESLQSTTRSGVRSVYLSDLQNFAGDNSSGGVIVHHCGEFSHGMINGLAESTEELMVSNGDSKKTIKRVFSILIEGLQNIRAHGERDTEGDQSAYLVIARDKEMYKIIFGNLVLEKDREMIMEYFTRINHMSEEQLKNLYMEILNNGFFTRKGGAGLGFLTMRMKSEHPLEYSFQKIDDRLCFFRVEIAINRNL